MILFRRMATVAGAALLAAGTCLGGVAAASPAPAAHAQAHIPWGARVLPGVPVVRTVIVDGKRYPVYQPKVHPRGAGPFAASRQQRKAASPQIFRTDEIKNLNSGKCLEVNGWSKSNGAQVDQWTCYSGHANQTWKWQLDGYVKISGGSGNCCDIVELINSNSGKCAEAYNFGTANGTKIDQWTCYQDGNQEWIEDPGIPCYQGLTFANYNAYLLGHYMMMEVIGAGKSNGNKVDLYQSNGGSNQKWVC